MSDPSGHKTGDLFDSIDEAARDAAIYLGALSWENGWEYATSIYSKNVTVKTKVPVTKRFLCRTWQGTKTVKTKKVQYTYKVIKTNKNPMVVTPPVKKNSLAILHTHPIGSGEGITRFSRGDIAWADKKNMLLYVHGPNGELRKYDPATGDDILIFSDLPVSSKTPWLERRR